MPIYQLPPQLWFPHPDEAEPDGLLAVGGDLSVDRLLLAYKSGIFPWFDEDSPILWWSPDPRFVLFPNELKISQSMKSVIKKNIFEIRYNTAFEMVICNCGATARKGQDGTWITDEMKNAYIELHRLGYAISVEAWKDKILVGGLYGVRLGNVFFGESMFSHASNASKAAFISFVQKEKDLQIIDCQVHTAHLESLGARFIDRVDFLNFVNAIK
ncbi:MAG: leucyl/phenylalanyl-tRNA--protein transferase [Bacteroidota bacterium]|nr:leucyl/phenylalanyl-tRNA--protein transferase [Bacteroidota bacterium]